MKYLKFLFLSLAILSISSCTLISDVYNLEKFIDKADKSVNESDEKISITPKNES